jgi:4-amino-4-deoxy-L-arabinose transferase-like glycosyltransferase
MRWYTPLAALLVLGTVGALVYMWNDLGLGNLRPTTATQDTAEALARARSAAGGQLSTFEQMMIRKPRLTLDNATILKLWRANVGPTVILQMIKTSNPDFDLSANAIIELKQAGVEQSVIMAMIDFSYTQR